MFGVSVDYEDLPPLIPVDMLDMLDMVDMLDMLDASDFHGFNPSPSLSIEYKNPIKDIMVGWEDVDAGYIEKLARVHFNEQYDKMLLSFLKLSRIEVLPLLSNPIINILQGFKLFN